MASARESEPRSTAHNELEAILRDADVARRRAGSEVVPHVAPIEPTPRLSAVPGRGPGAGSPPARQDIRFDTFDVRLNDPGEMKIKTFRLSGRAVFAMVLAVVTAVLWVLSPNGVGFLRPSPLPDSYTEASSRWAMVLTAQRIDRFRADRARLPESLEELGPAPSELISYERLTDGQYRLQAPGTNSPLTLGPASSREIFAANSLDVLRLGPDKAP